MQVNEEHRVTFTRDEVRAAFLRYARSAKPDLKLPENDGLILIFSNVNLDLNMGLSWTQNRDIKA